MAGQSKGDGSRSLEGQVSAHVGAQNGVGAALFIGNNGAFMCDVPYLGTFNVPSLFSDGVTHYARVGLKNSRVMPVFSVNRVRSYGVLVCAYLGRPAL